MEQTRILLEDAARGHEIKTVYADLGYRGVDADNPGVTIIHRGKIKSLTQQQRRALKRRQAVEPTIGHLKADNRQNRCHLLGSLGDALHAVLCAAGYNLRWLMRAVRRLGLQGSFFVQILKAWKWRVLWPLLWPQFFAPVRPVAQARQPKLCFPL